MKQLYIYLVLLILAVSCESVYIPDLDEAPGLLVVDARLSLGSENRIYLYKSKGFNEPDVFEPVSAIVQLHDDQGQTYNIMQDTPGQYKMNFVLDTARLYWLYIIWEGERYRSVLPEAVPSEPKIDSAYIESYEKWVQPGGETDAGSFLRTQGQRLYVDINDNQPAYYRFTSRLILQYSFPFDTVIGTPVTLTKYCWTSFYPDVLFNIAGPSDYSSKMHIRKHPAEFFPYYDFGFLGSDERGEGWIYIMQQHKISEQAYRYYNDLNIQLGAKGKIFDPLYVQARSNLECITNPDKIVLGNFEISRVRQNRYFIKMNTVTGVHKVRPIHQYYAIPERGINSMYKPYFWED